MTTYSEKSGTTLLQGANDPDGDPISVRRINGAIVTQWPHTVSTTLGTVTIAENGAVAYDDLGTTTGHPEAGSTQAEGSFTFTIWDGTDESPEYTATITLEGQTSYSAPVNSVAPSLTGAAAVGGTLTCDPGTWTGSPGPTLGYQWQADSGSGFHDISGATLVTHVVQSAESGASIRCRVTATNSEGSASANSNSVTISESISDLTPEATYSTISALLAAVDAAIANPTGSHRILGLSGDHSAETLNLGARTAPAAGITIRGVGTFTNSGATCKLGNVDFTGARRFRVMLFEMIGANLFPALGSTDCTVERCYLKGSDINSIETVQPGVSYLIRTNAGYDATTWPTRFTLKDNAITRYVNGLFITGRTDDMLIEGNVFYYARHDDMKFDGNHYRPVIRNNWGSRNRTDTGNNQHHENFLQVTGGFAKFWNATIEGNVIMEGPWYQDSTGGLEVIIFSNGSYTDGLALRQNITAGGNYFAQFKEATAQYLNVTCDYNTNLTSTPLYVGGYNVFPLCGVGTRSYNVVAIKTGLEGYVGTGGMAINVGDPTDVKKQTTPLGPLSGDTSRACSIGALLPAAGSASPLHWNYSGQKVGAWQTLRRVFADGGHPENVGWPVAHPFHVQYNFNNEIAGSTWTGSYDSNGANV